MTQAANDTLTWRFGEIIIPIQVERAGGTWKLTARGARDILIATDGSFAGASKKLRDKIEDKIREHRARQAGVTARNTPTTPRGFRG